MGIWDSILGKKSAGSARDRLQLVLIHDRINLNIGTLELMKDDIIKAISKHIEIDPSLVRIEIEQDGRSQRLVADIPIRAGSAKKN